MERLKRIFGREEELPLLSFAFAPKTRQSVSPEQVIANPDLFTKFLFHGFLDFFQQVDTGPIENLPAFIKGTLPESLPPNLRRAQKKVFIPFFRRLGGKEERCFAKIAEKGLLEICRMLCQQIEENQIPLNASVQKEYERYVQELLHPQQPSQPNLPKPKKQKSPPQNQEILRPSSTKKTDNLPVLQIILKGNQPAIEITSQEELEAHMRKIKHLGPLKAELVWKKLLGLQAFFQESPKQISPDTLSVSLVVNMKAGIKCPLAKGEFFS